MGIPVPGEAITEDRLSASASYGRPAQRAFQDGLRPPTRPGARFRLAHQALSGHARSEVTS